MSITIYHNPKCGTSRNVLAIIRASGGEPTIVEYLKTGWTRPQLKELFAAAGISPHDALRTFKTNAAELGLTDPEATDDTLLQAMVADPVLVNRPIVVSAKGTALCRPADKVIALLDKAPTAPVLKPDGSVIWASNP
ncbi:arsenate reductase (glutaredoxin) [Nereida sp. MMG025]|uniref:arsenate reductase (glutaredoxin) n=1 Tax=Nereida sp. MMG025 TaxID=2909981 RepID=UPI001EEE0B44|nr:arsenate reductase (glutaredoxin) [Nereida sp. MMG025]MCF6444961.1 arsenate reductase (glutaredoxin) [Nereida sp. MMG025]